MINSIAFAKNSIERIIAVCESVQCRYEYHEASYTHFIEVVPNTTYRLDDHYIALEESIVSEFEGLFPTEFICFITDDSTYKIENPILVRRGVKHGTVSFKHYPYATLDSMERFYEGFGSSIDYMNEADRHGGVIMEPDKNGCLVTLEESPPSAIMSLKNTQETLYITESFV